MLNIQNIVKELKKNNPDGFINETHLQFEFAIALAATHQKVSKIVLEWKSSRWRIDLYCEYKDERYCFEFKYFTEQKTITIKNSLTLQLKNQASCDLARIGFWRDIFKLEQLLNKNKIDYGYCFLISNAKNLFKKQTTQLCSAYDISDGTHTKSIKKYTNSSGRLIDKYTCNIMNDYLFRTSKYNNSFQFLLVEVKK